MVKYVIITVYYQARLDIRPDSQRYGQIWEPETLVSGPSQESLDHPNPYEKLYLIKNHLDFALAPHNPDPQ